MDSHLVAGNDTVWKATGCTYWKKCWTIIEVHLQQPNRRLILQEKIQWRKNVKKMNGEVPQLREGDHVHFYQSDEKGVYVVLDRDANPRTFTLEKMIEGQLQPTLAAQPDRQEASQQQQSHSQMPLPTAPRQLAAQSSTRLSARDLLRLSGADWEQRGVKGVQILELEGNSSAELAGLHKGDVITTVNGKEVRSTQELDSILSEMGRPVRSISIGYLLKTQIAWIPRETVVVIATTD